ncbi:hypothetical protein CR513_05706, partial [Mucuna pruriens]
FIFTWFPAIPLVVWFAQSITSTVLTVIFKIPLSLGLYYLMSSSDSATLSNVKRTYKTRVTPCFI